MSNLLEEYKAYYKVRAEKYANNPKYINTYQAEKDLSDAMQSCQTLEEFKDKIGNKNEMCAIALVKDESKIEYDFYNKYNEKIRQLSSQRILSKIDDFNNSQDLTTFVVEEINKNSIEIAMDEANTQLLLDWHLLENYEIYQKAVVPDNYKASMLETTEENKQALIRNVNDLENNNDSWQSNWKINPNIALEERFIDKFPYKKDHVKEQTEKYAKLINR